MGLEPDPPKLTTQLDARLELQFLRNWGFFVENTRQTGATAIRFSQELESKAP